MTRRPLTEVAHQQLHKLPGMPEHSESTRLGHRGGLSNRPLPNRPLTSPHISDGYREPKVFIGWQNMIARLVARRSR